MGRQFRTTRINPQTSQEDLPVALESINQNLLSLFEGINRISLADPTGPLDSTKVPNLDATFVIFTSSSAPDTDVTVQHRLGRMPVGLINVAVPVLVGATPGPGEVYFGSLAPSSTQVTLRCVALSHRACVILF